MLILLPSLLAATLISCIPFSDDLNDIQDDQTWNVDSIDSSNIAFEKDEETETGLNDIAQACSSSPDTNGILRRASMCKPTGIVGPEEPSEGVTLQPKLSSDFKLKTPSDRECVNFPQRPHYVTCGGPEVYSRSDQFRDSTLVYNCFAGRSLHFHFSSLAVNGWSGFNDKFAARGWFEATTKFARYCCAEFTDQVSR